MKKLIFVFLILLVFSIVNAAQDLSIEKNSAGTSRPAGFSGGDGSEGNPWQIANLVDLQYLSENSGYWGDNFIQIANIDASITNTWNVGDHDDQSWTADVAMGFSPIGNETTSFTGDYNGQQYAISSLFINRSATDNIGLFGSTNGCNIENLGLTSVSITGDYKVGSIAGWILSNSIIRNCYSTGTIPGYFGWYHGGLVGRIESGSQIYHCYSTCAVSGSAYIGGLVGHGHTCTITDSYATGDVVGNDYAGGLICFMASATTLTNCFSIGHVTGDVIGGLAGVSVDSAVANECFWDMDASGLITSARGTGKTTAEMQEYTTFTVAGWDFVSETANGTDDYWDMDQLGTVNNGYPILNWQEGADEVLEIFSGGDGSVDDPWQIADLDDLQYLSENSGYWTSYFIQTTDIDASSTSTWNGGEGFIPIGVDGGQFRGNYDGNNHVIEGLVVNRPTVSFQGMFGVLYYANVSNLGLVDITVNGNQRVGGLLGNCSYSNISNCFVVGSVTGNMSVGGFAGYISTDPSYKIENCFARCTVIGGGYTGGFAGYHTTTWIKRCYCVGTVTSTSPSSKGAFIGYSSSTNREYNYWDANIEDMGGIGDGDLGTGEAGLPTSAMQTESSFIGWDFVGEIANGTDEIWEIDAGHNLGYPYLNWDYFIDHPLPVTLSSFTAIYNGDNPVIQWITCSEMQNSGWNVYRNCEEDYSSSLKLNIDLISGAGSSTETHNYAYQDEYEVDNGICYYYWLESLTFGGESENFGPIALNIPEEEEEETPPVPDQYNLLPNYPNPFNPETTIRYNLPYECMTELSIYNIKGKKVITLVKENQVAGYYSHIWDGKDENGLEVSSGIYIYRLETEYYKMAKTMVLVK